MRIVKEAEERKNEILDVAEILFGSKGFDNTSTNDILNEVGIARGTLYYHFKSKEDILDAMIERMTERLCAAAVKIAQDESIPVLNRISQTILALNVNEDIGTEVMNQIHKPQNALMHQKVQERMLSSVVPIMSQLIEEGIGQEIFHTDYPMQAAEMLMVYSNEAFDSQRIQSEEEKQQRMFGFIYNAERILGMKQGTLQDVIMVIFQNI